MCHVNPHRIENIRHSIFGKNALEFATHKSRSNTSRLDGGPPNTFSPNCLRHMPGDVARTVFTYQPQKRVMLRCVSSVVQVLRKGNPGTL